METEIMSRLTESSCFPFSTPPLNLTLVHLNQVHRCRELKTQHVYAAKFIPIGHAMEKALIRKEIDIMNHLHHCKLINLHDAFEDEDEMVLIFEL